MRNALFLSLVMMVTCFSLLSEDAPKVKRRRYTHPSHIPQIMSTHNVDGSRCTGWGVAPDVVMTAGHCTKFLGEHVLVFFEGAKKPAMFSVVKRVLVNPAYSSQDMAILKGPTGDLSPIPLSDDEFNPTRKWCAAIGYGGEKEIQQVTLCRTYAEVQHMSLLPVAGEIIGGDSGGPVIDEKGEVIGITESYVRDGSPTFFIVPAAVIKKFLIEAGVL